MPQTRHRHKNHPHHSHPQPPQPSFKPTPKKNAKIIFTIFLGLLGVAIAFFSGGTDTLYLTIGGAAGAIIGFLIGNNIDKTASKKK